MQKKEFNSKDSSIAFILSIIVPNVLAFIVLFIANSFMTLEAFRETSVYKIISTTISQIAFIFIILFMFKQSRVKFSAIKHDKINFKQALIIILIGIICILFISPIINVYDAFLESLGIASQSLSISLDKPLNLIYLIFSLGLLAPICEELLFRGIITSGLKQKGETKAVILSALMFMLMHLSIHQTIYQFILGAVLAFIYVYTNNIFASILLHFINNTLVLLINYFSPSFFEYRFLTSNYIILALVLFLVGGFLIYNLLKLLKSYKKDKAKEKNKDNNYMENALDQSFSENFSENENTKIQKTKLSNWLIISLIVGVLIWIFNLIMSI